MYQTNSIYNSFFFFGFRCVYKQTIRSIYTTLLLYHQTRNISHINCMKNALKTHTHMYDRNEMRRKKKAWKTTRQNYRIIAITSQIHLYQKHFPIRFWVISNALRNTKNSLNFKIICRTQEQQSTIPTKTLNIFNDRMKCLRPRVQGVVNISSIFFVCLFHRYNIFPYFTLLMSLFLLLYVVQYTTIQYCSLFSRANTKPIDWWLKANFLFPLAKMFYRFRYFSFNRNSIHLLLNDFFSLYNVNRYRINVYLYWLHNVW